MKTSHSVTSLWTVVSRRRLRLALRRSLRPALVAALVGVLACPPQACAIEEVLPAHVTKDTIKSVKLGLDYLARTQGADGGWHEGQAGQAYPTAMTGLAGMALLASGSTPSRGRYATHITKAIEFLLTCSTPSGLLTGPGQDNGRPMHGHGFALLFLATAYGMETKESLRNRTKEVIDKAVALTARGQSAEGGWTYFPGGGDEGSVTVTQVQALRAVHNAGLNVPRGTIEEAVRYIDKCQTSEGGIAYSLSSLGSEPQMAISCAAVATLYNAGEYDSPVANRCLEYVWKHFHGQAWVSVSGHDYYGHLYAAQAFYMSGDKYWKEYFPAVRDRLVGMQDKSEGAWQGDYIGKVYGTSIALIILQLPYKYLPVYQR